MKDFKHKENEWHGSKILNIHLLKKGILAPEVGKCNFALIATYNIRDLQYFDLAL